MIDQIGARLLEERRRLGLSQTEMGKAGGVAMRTYHTYESGARCPDAECLANLFAAGVDVLYVVTGVRQASSLSNEESALLSALGSVDQRMRDSMIAGMLTTVRTYNTI